MIYAGECARVSQRFPQATTRYGAFTAMCIAASAVQTCCGPIRYRLDNTLGRPRSQIRPHCEGQWWQRRLKRTLRRDTRCERGHGAPPRDEAAYDVQRPPDRLMPSHPARNSAQSGGRRNIKVNKIFRTLGKFDAYSLQMWTKL